MKINDIQSESWSQKYKSSIDCSHPRGFSQRAHCAGKNKQNESVEMEMTCEDCGMCKSHGSLNEIKKGAKDSNGYTRCWPGKHAEGTKKGKNGGQVRNCVPNESIQESKQRCQQCGMTDCSCRPGTCKCKPVKGWIPNKGFQKAMAEADMTRRGFLRGMGAAAVAGAAGLPMTAKADHAQRRELDMRFKGGIQDALGVSRQELNNATREFYSWWDNKASPAFDVQLSRLKSMTPGSLATVDFKVKDGYITDLSLVNQSGNPVWAKTVIDYLERSSGNPFFRFQFKSISNTPENAVFRFTTEYNPPPSPIPRHPPNSKPAPMDSSMGESVNQGVAEDFNGEYDDEAGMAQGNLYTIAQAAQGLLDTIDDHDNLPEWAQEKIAKVEGMLVTVWNYLQSQKAQGIDPKITEMYEAMDQLAEEMAQKNGVSVDTVWESFEALPDNMLYETAAWRRKEGKSKKGGLNAKGVASYRRENPGSKLQTAVTTKPSKLKPGSKAAKRRKSFCARMSGVKGPAKKPNGEPTRKTLALRKWNC